MYREPLTNNETALPVAGPPRRPSLRRPGVFSPQAGKAYDGHKRGRAAAGGSTWAIDVRLSRSVNFNAIPCGNTLGYANRTRLSSHACLDAEVQFSHTPAGTFVAFSWAQKPRSLTLRPAQGATLFPLQANLIQAGRHRVEGGLILA